MTTTLDKPAATRVRLTDMRTGQRGRLVGADLQPEVESLLDAMGLCHDADISICRTGEPFIIRVGCCTGASSRIGLARNLANAVFIEPLNT